MITRAFIGSLVVSATLLGGVTVAETTHLSEATTEHVAINNSSVKQLVKPITEKVILPLYGEAAKQVNLLNKATLAFCEKPHADTLTVVRSHWSLALSAWQASEIALFGPGLKKQRDLHIYFRPVKKRVIKKLWKGEETITLDIVNFAGVGAKGFATYEYLLLDRSLTVDEIVSRFNTTSHTRECQHLLAISTLLKDDINAIYHAWATDYPATLATSDQALSLILGQLDQTAEAVSNKLRNPLAKDAHLAGKDDHREKRNAHKLEAWRSGHTLQNIQANLFGIKQMLTEGGFIHWLNENKHTALANKLSQQLITIDAITFQSTDLFLQIEASELTAADTLFTESMRLSRLIKDMSAAMGIPLGFNDNDGD